MNDSMTLTNFYEFNIINRFRLLLSSICFADVITKIDKKCDFPFSRFKKLSKVFDVAINFVQTL